MEPRSFEELEKSTGLTLSNNDLLNIAFTHGSMRGSVGTHDLEDYRKLEFVGDAVIRLVASEYVYGKSDGSVENLHNRREKLVPNAVLAGVSKELDLVRFLRWSGSGEIPKSRKVLSKIYESLVGAVFLEKGYAGAAEFLKRSLLPKIQAKAES